MSTSSSQESHEAANSIDQSPSSSLENDVFSISPTLVPPAPVKTAGTTSETFDGLLHTPLLLHEDLREGCGGQLWPAGMVLAKYMLTLCRSQLHGKSIIEIGAGGGLVGLAVALGCELGPGAATDKILITDQDAMLALMQKNIALNHLTEKVEAQVYDWGTRAPTFSTKSGMPDIVLAADCVYFEPAFPLLLQTLMDLVGPDTSCYFCFKKRRKADMRFLREMRKKFGVSDVQYNGREADQKQGIHLLEVRNRQDKTGKQNR